MRKEEIPSVLKADFMSLKDSEYEDITTPRDGDSSGSELEDSTSSKTKKRLIKHKPRWRCREMQSTVESLDMKIGRCRDAKAKEMCLEVIEGEDSTDPSGMGYLNGQRNFLIDFDSTPVHVHVLTVFIQFIACCTY